MSSRGSSKKKSSWKTGGTSPGNSRSSSRAGGTVPPASAGLGLQRSTSAPGVGAAAAGPAKSKFGLGTKDLLARVDKFNVFGSKTVGARSSRLGGSSGSGERKKRKSKGQKQVYNLGGKQIDMGAGGDLEDASSFSMSSGSESSSVAPGSSLGGSNVMNKATIAAERAKIESMRLDDLLDSDEEDLKTKAKTGRRGTGKSALGHELGLGRSQSPGGGSQRSNSIMSLGSVPEGEEDLDYLRDPDTGELAPEAPKTSIFQQQQREREKVEQKLAEEEAARRKVVEAQEKERKEASVAREKEEARIREMEAMAQRLRELEAREKKKALEEEEELYRPGAGDLTGGGDSIDFAIEEEEVEEVADSPSSGASSLNAGRGVVQMGVAGLHAYGESVGEASVGKASRGSGQNATSVGPLGESLGEEQPKATPKKPATVPQTTPTGSGVDLAAMQQMMQMMMTTMQQGSGSGRPLGEREPNQAPVGQGAKDHQALLDRVEFLEAELLRVKARADMQPAQGTARPMPEAREAWGPPPPPPAPIWPGTAAPGGSASGYATLGSINVNGRDPALQHGVQLIHSMFSHQVQLLRQSVRSAYHHRRPNSAKEAPTAVNQPRASPRKKAASKELTMEMALKIAAQAKRVPWR